MFSWQAIDNAGGFEAHVLRTWQARLAAQLQWMERQYALDPSVRQGVCIAQRQRLLAEIGDVAAAAEHEAEGLRDRLAALRIALSAHRLLLP